MIAMMMMMIIIISEYVNVIISHYFITLKRKYLKSSFGGLEVACWPLEPNLAGFFRAKKSSTRLPSEG
jgi:hypothetical protein